MQTGNTLAQKKPSRRRRDGAQEEVEGPGLSFVHHLVDQRDRACVDYLSNSRVHSFLRKRSLADNWSRAHMLHGGPENLISYTTEQTDNLILGQIAATVGLIGERGRRWTNCLFA